MSTRFAHKLSLVALLFATTLLASCTQAPNSTPSDQVTVFAASSLTGAFTHVKTTLEQQGDLNIIYSFAGSQALTSQLSQGAKADVFASADAKNMDAAISAGVVDTGTQQVLLTNRLIVAVERGANRISILHDLANPGIKLVLAADSVPAGSYTSQVLANLSNSPDYGPAFKGKVLANVVSREDNVRQVLAKVELGEADAGIVYATDARVSKVDTLQIPDPYNVIARYYIAPLKSAPNPQAANRFISYVLSDEGQKLLEQYGFGRAEGTR